VHVYVCVCVCARAREQVAVDMYSEIVIHVDCRNCVQVEHSVV